MQFPVVLGSGKRLCDAGTVPRTLSLLSGEVTSGGVLISAWRPDGGVATGSFANEEPSELELWRRERIRMGEG